jgi:hypothetical protein
MYALLYLLLTFAMPTDIAPGFAIWLGSYCKVLLYCQESVINVIGSATSSCPATGPNFECLFHDSYLRGIAHPVPAFMWQGPVSSLCQCTLSLMANIFLADR